VNEENEIEENKELISVLYGEIDPFINLSSRWKRRCYMT
jgi:hypothetical protein